MFVILGLVLLTAAVVVGVAAVVGNVGGGHELLMAFKVFGYHLTGSAGALFLFGVIVGGVAVLGLGLLVAGAGRSSRRARSEHHDRPAAPGEHRHRRHPFGHRTAPH
ncbi:hypothetical protein [Streptomyces sp. NPDC059080]|uniref:hypothetical protein n=1 Tax=Streptomyces sp. NPDC059080 TaxID=3346718 RepID=UPI003681BE98